MLAPYQLLQQSHNRDMAGKGGNEMRLFVRLGRFFKAPISQSISQIDSYSADYAGTRRDPKLVVTYTVSGEEFIPQIQII